MYRTRAVWLHVQVTVIVRTMKPAAQTVLHWDGEESSLGMPRLCVVLVYMCVISRRSLSHGRGGAGAHGPAGPGRRGAEPRTAPGRGGPRARERMAGPGQRVLTGAAPRTSQSQVWRTERLGFLF